MTEHFIDGVSVSTIDDIIRQIAGENRFNLTKPTIREVGLIRAGLSKRIPGFQVIGMDMGIPGLDTPQFILDAQKAAITGKACSQYAPFDGIPQLKEAVSYFVNQFLGITVEPRDCIPTVGGMHGCKEAIGIVGRLDRTKNNILVLTPSFSVNFLQGKVYDVKMQHLDFHELYGNNLVAAIDQVFQQGTIAGILWSSPNNPTWRVFSERELEGIGKLCTNYNVIAIEDAAYFGLDSRMTDRRAPGKPPYFPTIATYTKNWIKILSASKIFDYAGERVGAAIISHDVAELKSNRLKRWYDKTDVWHAFVQGGLYSSVACVSQSAQYAFTAALKASGDGSFNYFEYDRPYETKARAVRDILLNHGLNLQYNKDDFGPMGYGYYATLKDPQFNDGGQLTIALLRCGMTTVPVRGFGGDHNEGVRLCTATLTPQELDLLPHRVRIYRELNPH